MSPDRRRKKSSSPYQDLLGGAAFSMAAGLAAALLVILVIVICEAIGHFVASKKTVSASAAQVQQETQAAKAAVTETPAPAADPYPDKPDIDIQSWQYILANPTHSIEDYNPPEVEQFRDVYLDSRIISDMSDFVSGAEAQGLNVVMASGYRSYEEQTALFENKKLEYDEETAATIVARPGTSEHQTGLAADITDDYYEYKNESLENTDLYKWMSAHCQEYGFIVRFPKGKQDITGIIYEPCHFRYVGKEAAAFIMKHGLTLEEFVELYQ